jgi:hypothetical protein
VTLHELFIDLFGVTQVAVLWDVTLYSDVVGRHLIKLRCCWKDRTAGTTSDVNLARGIERVRSS